MYLKISSSQYKEFRNIIEIIDDKLIISDDKSEVINMQNFLIENINNYYNKITTK